MEPYQMHECYVCYEPCDTLADCKCKTLYVHSSCIAIMRLYGKNECGVCKEPYPTISRPLELIEEDFIREPPPLCCYMIPTQLRPEYTVTDCDQCLDCFRVIFFIVIIFLLYLSLTNFKSEDFMAPFVICFLSIMLCCFVAEQRARRLHRMQDQLEHHETQVA